MIVHDRSQPWAYGIQTKRVEPRCIHGWLASRPQSKEPSWKHVVQKSKSGALKAGLLCNNTFPNRVSFDMRGCSKVIQVGYLRSYAHFGTATLHVFAGGRMASSAPAPKEQGTVEGQGMAEGHGTGFATQLVLDSRYSTSHSSTKPARFQNGAKKS